MRLLSTPHARSRSSRRSISRTPDATSFCSTSRATAKASAGLMAVARSDCDRTPLEKGRPSPGPRIEISAEPSEAHPKPSRGLRRSLDEQQVAVGRQGPEIIRHQLLEPIRGRPHRVLVWEYLVAHEPGVLALRGRAQGRVDALQAIEGGLELRDAVADLVRSRYSSALMLLGFSRAPVALIRRG
jgi:hypothetical protein